MLLQVKEAQKYLRDPFASAPRVRPRVHSSATARGAFDMGALREELKQFRQNSANNEVHTGSSRAKVQPRSSPALRIEPLHAASSASNVASTGSRPGEGTAVSPQTKDGTIAESNRQWSRRRMSIFGLCEDLCNFRSTQRENTPEVYFIGNRDICDTIYEQPTSENYYTQESTWQ